MKCTLFNLGWNTSQDGPGQRIVLYFKGCNFRCLWCANPESFSYTPQLLLYPQKEKYSTRILNSCPYNAINLAGTKTQTNRTVCQSCKTYDCVDKCIDQSRELVGKVYTVEELVSYIKRYIPFFGSQGGVTVTGGEPTCQGKFLAELLTQLKRYKIHTTIETNCSAPGFTEFIPLLDLIIIDLKHINPEIHRKLTGLGNERVLENIRKVLQKDIPIWIRIPIVSTLTDSETNVKGIAEFLSPFKNKCKVELIAYHEMGLPKWGAVGLKYTLPKINPPSPQMMSKLKHILCSFGLTVIKT